MNVSTILQTYFANMQQFPIKDPRRLTAVIACASGLESRRVLSVTGLGRGIKSDAKTKHNIKRASRLVGNSHLHRERVDVYRQLSTQFLKGIKHPLIIVDWSPVGHVDKQLLRACIPIGGRTFTLYEEVHPEKSLGSRQVHERFIQQLACFIPDGCVPIITTDAGFKIPWFKPVEKQGWYWLGRVRGKIKCRITGVWQYCSELFKQATNQPKSLGRIELTRDRKHPCQAVLFSKQLKGRKAKRYSGKTRGDVTSLAHAKAGREPWLLASNLPVEWSAQHLVGLYSERMQIEEGFRETKNPRYGLSLNLSGTRCEKRLQILLMISMLTEFAFILVGKAAYVKAYHRDFQANTISNRRVLSYSSLGREIIRDGRYILTLYDLALAFSELKAQYEGDRS